MMKILRYILFPFAPIYYLVTWFRNKLYDVGIKKSKSYNFPVICVGNLSVGGTGKTPMIEYLISILKNDYKVATLSRGYKRQTKGYYLADKKASALTIGDEPFQFYSKFKKDISVAVDANRQNGISELQKLKNSPEIILLDDAYQHRKVKAGLNILLTTYTNPYFEDFVLPTGDLREPKHGVKRADIIVVTKCPDDLDEATKAAFIKQIRPNKNQSIFFSSIGYSNEVISENSNIELKDLSNFTLVTGIANAKPLVDFLNSKHLNFEHLNFKDHHEFSQQDISELNNIALDSIEITERLLKRIGNWDVSLPQPVFLEGAVWKRRQLDLYDVKYPLAQPE